MKNLIKRFPVLTFVLLTLGYQFLVVGFVWWWLPAGVHMHDDATAHMVFRLRVFGPLVFAMLLSAYLEGRAGLRNLFASFLHWKVPGRWYALAFSWKFLFTYVGIAIMVIAGIRGWPGFVVHDFFGGSWIGMKNLMLSMPFIVGIAFVEESAWMKFCVTRMQERYSAFWSCFMVGIGWGLWYLPMLLVGEGVPDGYPWPVFLLSMVCLTILLGWTYNMTHSGTVLLIMQIIANCAFFIIPVLPGWHDGDATYVTAFVAANFASAVILVLVYGWRELGTKPRARWSDGMPDRR
ncbi:MAG: hypothetical protein IPJ85_15900 [Flavobacteriales bacterium]|nr:hypothetical protein [Flavobacteriales bacterium]